MMILFDLDMQYLIFFHFQSISPLKKIFTLTVKCNIFGIASDAVNFPL